MLFDKLCKIAEREIPEVEKKLRTIKIFHFPGNPHEFLPKQIDDEIVKFLKEEFMLPFQSVAIEDDAGLVILEDLKRNIKGINRERKFIDIVSLAAPDSAFREDDASRTSRNKQLLEAAGMMDYKPITITYGAIEDVRWVSGKNFMSYGRLDRITTAFLRPYKKKHIYSDYYGPTLNFAEKEVIQAHLKSAMMNAMTALQEVLYTNTPNRFIVQISPAKEKSKKKKFNKIARSDQRSKYILLKPKQIRELIKEEIPKSPSGRSSPIVHERRAHPRTFHSDRFKKMQGKTIMIPAVWIGISEKTIGNKHYKVMLDM
jgi:hypothetical protein